MRRLILILLAVVILVPILAIGGLMLAADHPRTRAFIEERASEALGRPVRVGKLDISPGLTTRITLSDLSLAEAEWSDREDMASVESATVSIDLWESLLDWNLVLPELTVRKAEVYLTRNDEGEANWVFGGEETDDAEGEGEPVWVPEIDRIAIEDSRIVVSDRQTGVEFDSQIHTVLGGDEGDDTLSLAGNGTLNGVPTELAIDAGAPASLFGDEDYPARVDLTIGEVNVTIDGTIADPFDNLAVDSQMSLTGNDPESFFDALYLPAPSLPPFDISGHFHGSEGKWTLENMDAHMGDSDGRGLLSLDTTVDPPLLTVDVQADLLDVDDFGGLIGLPPDTGEGETASAGQEQDAAEYEQSDKLLPNPKIEPGRWDTIDVDLQLEAARVDAPEIPLDDVSVRMTLTDGVMRLEPLETDLADGQATLWMTLDTIAQPVRVDIELIVSAVRLGRFFTAQEVDPEAFGALSGRLKITGRGADLNAVLASGDGDLSFTMEAGRIDSLILELVGLDVAESLALVASEGETDPEDASNVRCVVGRFGIEDGLFTSQSLLIDTTDSKIVGEGTIELPEETMDLRIASQAKDPSLLSGASPVTIGGTFRDPSIGIETAPIAAQGLASLALGALLTPLAAVLPFIDLGLAEDSPCAELMQQAREAEE